MKPDLKIILKARKNRKLRSGVPIKFFMDKYFDADDLFSKINKKIKTRRLNQEARKQYLISLVTSFEVYFKEIFIWLIDRRKLDISRLEEVLNRKFSFDEVLLIKKKKISTGELVASQFNFQELENIEKAFSKLLSMSFFSELQDYKFYFGKGKKDFIQLEKDFYPKLKKLLQLRHDFVHDINFKDSLYINEINDLSANLLIFISIADIFIIEFVKS